MKANLALFLSCLFLVTAGAYAVCGKIQATNAQRNRDKGTEALDSRLASIERRVQNDYQLQTGLWGVVTANISDLREWSERIRTTETNTDIIASNVNALRLDLDDELTKTKDLLGYLMKREENHTICISNILALELRRTQRVLDRPSP